MNVTETQRAPSAGVSRTLKLRPLPPGVPMATGSAVADFPRRAATKKLLPLTRRLVRQLTSTASPLRTGRSPVILGTAGVGGRRSLKPTTLTDGRVAPGAPVAIRKRPVPGRLGASGPAAGDSRSVAPPAARSDSW